MLKFIAFGLVIFLIHTLVAPGRVLWSEATLYASICAFLLLGFVYILSYIVDRRYQTFYANRMPQLNRRGLTPELLQHTILMVLGFAVLFGAEYLGDYLASNYSLFWK